MKKVWNMVIGGIENKIFNLFLGTFLVVTGAYLAVVLYQNAALADLVSDTNEKQLEMIQDITNDTMDQVVQTNLSSSSELQADRFNRAFGVLRSEVEILRDYADVLLEDPEGHPSYEVQEPDPAKEGQLSAQLIHAQDAVMSQAAQRRTGLMGNLAPMMVSLSSSFDEIGAIYAGTPDGAFIIVDNNPAGKFDENGSLVHIEPRDRKWYTDAVETGDICFSDVEKDFYSGRTQLTCSVPVYDKDGTLRAVIGADLFLDSLEEAIDASTAGGGFIFVVNQDGHVIFSPEKEGLLSISSGEAVDLRTYDGEISGFINTALEKKTGTQLINVGEEMYYMAGAPLDTVGWTAVTAVSSELIRLPADTMNYQYGTIQKGATETFRAGLRYSRTTIICILFVLLVLGIAASVILGRMIVQPLTKMTKEIGSLGGDHLQFKMKDVYHTGDEIQVLAESFADLSAKTLRYVEEVKNVTAEKERIGAEMNMATDIQASQLPSIFPPYPDRKEFNIYAYMTPAKEVGGDFYDFFLIDDDHLGMVIADVSGKGVPAALFMMIAKILIKNRLQNGDTPGKALENVNRQLLEGNSADMFVTVWCAVLTLSTGIGTAANAGHEHPAIRRAGGEYELVKYRHSPAVAMDDDIPYREHSFRMQPGDSLFVYTDGVPEANNDNREMFGAERMLEALNKEPDAKPEQSVIHVMKAINEFSKGCPQFDDITMLAMCYNGRKENS